MLLIFIGLWGCAKREAPSAASEQAKAGTPASPAAAAAAAFAAGDKAGPTQRKVIRSAELAIEVHSPAAAQSKVSSLVERLGGYIASSERSASADEGEKQTVRVQLVLRVPAERLNEALREIKRLGVGAETERIGSEDVTDEYIDVSARVANQRQLEQQLVTLLSQTQNVEAALKVHHELTNVRTEIDRLEGRKRFLETESALAKIRLTITPIRPVMTASGDEFGVSVRRAASDAVAIAAGVVTFGIRAAGVLLPLALLFGLPVLAVSWLRRRRPRIAMSP
jgi:hypothetical protein